MNTLVCQAAQQVMSYRLVQIIAFRIRAILIVPHVIPPIKFALYAALGIYMKEIV